MRINCVQGKVLLRLGFDFLQLLRELPEVSFGVWGTLSSSTRSEHGRRLLRWLVSATALPSSFGFILAVLATSSFFVVFRHGRTSAILF